MGRPWTVEDDAAIRRGRADGLTARQIGESIGRGIGAMRQRIHDLGLPPLTPEQRLATMRATLRGNVAAHPHKITWTPEQDATLRELWGQAVRMEEIADRIGKTRQSVHAHAVYIGLGKRDRQMLGSFNFSPRHSEKIAAKDTHRAALSGAHSWVVVGRIRTCSTCGARQFASDSLVGVAHIRVWVCDAPATCRRAA